MSRTPPALSARTPDDAGLRTVDPPRAWLADEVADYLRVNRRTVLRMAERGEIPSLRLGKLYRFDPQQITALFDAAASDE